MYLQFVHSKYSSHINDNSLTGILILAATRGWLSPRRPGRQSRAVTCVSMRGEVSAEY